MKIFALFLVVCFLVGACASVVTCQHGSCASSYSDTAMSVVRDVASGNTQATPPAMRDGEFPVVAIGLFLTGLIGLVALVVIPRRKWQGIPQGRVLVHRGSPASKTGTYRQYPEA